MQLLPPERIFGALDTAIALVEQRKIDAIFYKLEPDSKGFVLTNQMTQKLRAKLDPQSAELMRDILQSYCQVANVKHIDRMTFHAIMMSRHTRQGFPVQQLLDEQDWGLLKAQIDEKRLEYMNYYTERQREQRVQKRNDEEKYPQFTLTDNLSEALLRYRDTEQFSQNLYNNIREKHATRPISPAKPKSREKERQFKEIQANIKRSRTPLS